MGAATATSSVLILGTVREVCATIHDSDDRHVTTALISHPQQVSQHAKLINKSHRS
jgi:hypothetical protein